MSDETISLNEARAMKAQDARLWTPADALRAVLRDLENGKLKLDAVYIAGLTKGEDGNAVAWPFAQAGGTAIEMRGVLAQHIHEMCDRYKIVERI